MMRSAWRVATVLILIPCQFGNRTDPPPASVSLSRLPQGPWPAFATPRPPPYADGKLKAVFIQYIVTTIDTGLGAGM